MRSPVCMGIKHVCALLCVYSGCGRRGAKVPVPSTITHHAAGTMEMCVGVILPCALHTPQSSGNGCGKTRYAAPHTWVEQPRGLGPRVPVAWTPAVR